MARSHIGLALPWLVVIGRVFGRLDLRNVDRALPTCRNRNTYRAKGHRHVCSYMYSLHLQSRGLRPLPSMMCARTRWLCLSLATRHTPRTRAADTTTRRNRRSHLTGSGSVERWYHQLWYAINVLVQVRLPILQTLACTEARANH